jgi:hypothetical protein
MFCSLGNRMSEGLRARKCTRAHNTARTLGF